MSEAKQVYEGPMPGMLFRPAEKQPDNAPRCHCGKAATLYKVDHHALHSYGCFSKPYTDPKPHRGVASGWFEDPNDAAASFRTRRDNDEPVPKYEPPELGPHQLGALDQDQLVIDAWTRASTDGSTFVQIEQCVQDAEDRAIMSERWVAAVEALQSLCEADDSGIDNGTFRLFWHGVRANINKPE